MKVVRGGDTPAESLPWREHFSGTAWMDLLLQAPLTPVEGQMAVTSVTFTPGVRTHWHRHEGGQLLLVVAGQGWVGNRADGRQVVFAGDLIWTPSGEDHWHGATDTTTLTHIAVTFGGTHWHDEVVDLLE